MPKAEKQVLIATLGLSPGVVTGAYYALARSGVSIDEVMTITTNNPVARLVERQVWDELRRRNPQLKYRREQPTTAQTLDTTERVDAFMNHVGRKVTDYLDAGVDLHIVLSGGRKSMVASAVLAVQKLLFYGDHDPDDLHLFHIEIDDELEAEGHITRLLTLTPEVRSPYLNPPADKITLVDITALALAKPPTAEWSRLFEYLVGDYLIEKDYIRTLRVGIKPSFMKGVGKGEIDVWGERSDGSIIIGECKLRIDDAESKPVKVKEVRQALKKAQAVATQTGKAVTAAVYSNTPYATYDAIALANEEDIQLYHARIHRDWQTRQDWRVFDLASIAPAPT